MLNAEPVEGAAVGAERGDLLMQRLLELKGVMSVQDFFSGCARRRPWSA